MGKLDFICDFSKHKQLPEGSCSRSRLQEEKFELCAILKPGYVTTGVKPVKQIDLNDLR